MKIRYLFITAIVPFLLAACNYLDYDETNSLKTKENIYNYFNSTEDMLINIYSYMPQDLGTINGAMRDCASDDAEFGDRSSTIQDFNNGNWSPLKTWDDQWRLYSGIRAANSFLVDIEKVDFSRYEYSNDYKNMMIMLKLFPYEARVLRAFYFFELARRYGDIAMPLTVLSTEEANSIGKTKFEDVISFICTECEECAKELPDTYIGLPNNEFGRITKGVALAVRSKALLYAASELHNPTKDKEKWKKSASAALDLINTGLYQLDSKETANNVDSKEIVLFRMNPDNSNFELNNFPIRFTEGKRGYITSANFPSQNLVDAFETINGYPVVLTENGWESDDPQFDPQQPYANRDPRLYRAVLTDGSSFKGQEIEIYAGGKDDIPVSDGGSPTGYFLRKYIQESTSFTPDNEVKNKHLWVIYRYAETLLTYAESMVEAFDSPTYTDNVYNKSALEALNEVRDNAGMPAIPNCGKEEFMPRLRNEWRVEFSFEDHRFWDIRRWKIGDVTQKELYGISIVKESTGKKIYQRNLSETRMWNERMYLYPIPQSELFKNPNLLPQNNGWN